MNKKILLAGFLILLLQLPQAANAARPVRSWFAGWIGHKQSDHYLDTSRWIYCYGSRGGDCGTISLSTGRDRCTGWSFKVGVSWSLDKYIPGLKLSASGTRSWSACNTRSEIMGCKPKRGWKGRAIVMATARYGRMRFQGTRPYTYRSNNWNKALHACDTLGYWRASIQAKRTNARGYKYYESSCKTSTIDVKGYLPEKRWATCQYRRI